MSKEGPAKCRIDGCPRPAKTKGWCGRHYNSFYYHGDALHVDRGKHDPPPRRNARIGVPDENAFLRRTDVGSFVAWQTEVISELDPLVERYGSEGIVEQIGRGVSRYSVPLETIIASGIPEGLQRLLGNTA